MTRVLAGVVVVIGLAVVCAAAALERTPPHAPRPTGEQARAQAMRFQQTRNGQRQRVRGGAPDWWHYSAPWWSPPDHAATKSPPDFVDTPAYEKYKEPPAGTMAVYIPYGRDAMSWMETDARVNTHGSAKAKSHARQPVGSMPWQYQQRPLQQQMQQQMQQPMQAAGAPRFAQERQMAAQLAAAKRQSGGVPRIWRGRSNEYANQQRMMSLPQMQQQQMQQQQMMMQRQPQQQQPIYAGLSTGYAPAPEVSLAAATQPRFAMGGGAPAPPPPQMPPNMPSFGAVPNVNSDSSLDYEFGLPSALQLGDAAGLPNGQAAAPPVPGTPEYAMQEQAESAQDMRMAEMADYEFGAHERDAKAGAPVPRIWRVDRPLSDHDEDGAVTDRFEQQIEERRNNNMMQPPRFQQQRAGSGLGRAGAAADPIGMSISDAQSMQAAAHAQFEPDFDVNAPASQADQRAQSQFDQYAAQRDAADEADMREAADQFRFSTENENKRDAKVAAEQNRLHNEDSDEADADEREAALAVESAVNGFEDETEEEEASDSAQDEDMAAAEQQSEEMEEVNQSE